MHLSKTIAALCCWLALAIPGALAQGQAAQLGELHVAPPDPKEGVTISLRPSGNKIIASPEAVKMMKELMKTNGLESQPGTPGTLSLPTMNLMRMEITRTAGRLKSSMSIRGNIVQ